MKRKSGYFFFSFLLSASLLYAKSKPFPPPPTSYVYNENVISPKYAASLSQILSNFEQTTHHQFVAALFQSLNGENVEDYSNRLFQYWKIGDAKKNDGLLFCVFKEDHKWRVEVGYGLEPVLTDLESFEIVRRSAVPYFRQNDFDQGVLAAVSALAAKLSSKALPARSKNSQPAIPIGDLLSVFVIAIWVWLQSRRSTTIGRRYRRSGGYSNWGIMGGGGGFGDGGGFMGGGGMSGGGGASGGW